MKRIDLTFLVRKKTLYLFGCLMCLSGSVFAEGQFSQACHSVSLDLPYLRANCKSFLNIFPRSRININNYIGVESGNLTWKRQGNFMRQAKLCSLIGSNLGYLVYDIKKRLHYSVINLDEHIGNFYGNLVYQGP